MVVQMRWVVQPPHHVGVMAVRLVRRRRLVSGSPSHPSCGAVQFGGGRRSPYDCPSRMSTVPAASMHPTFRENEPMAKSDKRPIIKLKSTAGTGYTYVTRKNKTNTRERIELKKYDPKIRQHVIFKEER